MSRDLEVFCRALAAPSRPEFLDQNEAAEQLHISATELIGMTMGARARLRYLRLGSKMWFRTEDVDAIALKRARG